MLRRPAEVAEIRIVGDIPTAISASHDVNLRGANLAARALLFKYEAKPQNVSASDLCSERRRRDRRKPNPEGLGNQAPSYSERRRCDTLNTPPDREPLARYPPFAAGWRPQARGDTRKTCPSPPRGAQAHRARQKARPRSAPQSLRRSPMSAYPRKP